MVHVDGSEWSVHVEGDTVVLTLPRRLSLDEQSTERMYDTLSDAIARPEVDRVLTHLDVEHPLSAGLHDVVRRTARTAVANGVTTWDIVAEHEIKGVAMEQEIAGLETTVNADERAPPKQLA